VNAFRRGIADNANDVEITLDVVTAGPSGTTPSDVVITFINDAASLHRAIPSLAGMWPRKAAGHRSHVTDNVVRNTALPSDSLT